MSTIKIYVGSNESYDHKRCESVKTHFVGDVNHVIRHIDCRNDEWFSFGSGINCEGFDGKVAFYNFGNYEIIAIKRGYAICHETDKKADPVVYHCYNGSIEL